MPYLALVAAVAIVTAVLVMPLSPPVRPGVGPSPAAYPAQRQLWALLPALQETEAEKASGTYLPGIGAVIDLALVRGPNARGGAGAADRTRDWAQYILRTYGMQLTAISPNETITLAITFYDYSYRANRQLVITSRPADLADPQRQRVWLDGMPYGESAALSAGGAATPDIPRPVARPTTSAPSRNLAVSLDFADATATPNDWTPLSGDWTPEDGGYAQRRLDDHDFIAYYRERLVGDFRLEVTMRFIGGRMGGGLVFNAPRATSKQGAQMVSFNEAGTSVQWGYFDPGSGVFRFQGGFDGRHLGLNGADGGWHTLTVQLTAGTYSVSLDGSELGRQIPLAALSDGYWGLLASTSYVVFDDVRVERRTP